MTLELDGAGNLIASSFTLQTGFSQMDPSEGIMFQKNQGVSWNNLIPLVSERVGTEGSLLLC